MNANTGNAVAVTDPPAPLTWLEHEVATVTEMPVTALRILTDTEMQNRPKPKQVIKEMLLEGSTSSIVGPPGVGKGLLAIDLCYRIAHGMDYYGRGVEQGCCVYVALERAGGLGARIRAWKHHNRRPEPANVRFIDESFSLFDHHGARRLLETIKRLDEPVRVVVVDTAAKALLPGDENSTKEMGTFMKHQQDIAKLGANVLSLHHLNASGARERGSTAFRGDVDTLITVSKDGGEIKLECPKQNELPEFRAFRLSIVPVLEAESAAISGDSADSTKMLSDSALKVLRALAVGSNTSGTISATRAIDLSGLSAGSFYRTLDHLIANGYAARHGTGKNTRYSITESGKWAIGGGDSA